MIQSVAFVGAEKFSEIYITLLHYITRLRLQLPAIYSIL